MKKKTPGLLFVELSLGQDKAPPSEFRIFQRGENKSRKGTFSFSGAGMRECVERIAEFAADYPVDYNHAMFRSFSAADPASEGRAAGWFKPEVRNGELWATNVQWTEEGAQRLSAKEYRYISPAFNRNEKGEICELLNVALTNVPALTGLSPLMASHAALSETETKEDEMLEKILTMLGLKEGATEAEVEAKIKAILAGGEMLLSMTAKATESDAKVAELEKKIADMETAKVSAEVDALLDSAKRDGRVSPAQADAIREKGIADIGFLKTFLSAATKTAPDQKTEPGMKTMPIDEAVKAIAKNLGKTVEEITKLQEKRNQ